MHLPILTPTCLAIVFLSSQCGATEDYLRITTSRKVNQVYLQQNSGEDGINVPSESIPLPVSFPNDERRNLSFWSSVMSFLLCHHHDDHNPHCHHGGGGSSHSSSHSDGSGNGEEGGDDENNDGCGGDDCHDDDDDDYFDDDDNDDGNDDGNDDQEVTSSPTIFEDNISNDHSCWWCGRGQRNNGNSVNGSNSAEEGGNKSFSNYATGRSFAYVTVGVAGAAALISVFIRKRHECDTASGSSQPSGDHLLSGAVEKRKNKFSKIFAENDDTTMSTSNRSNIEVVAGKKKGFFSRLFSWKQSKNKIRQAPEEETPGSHYVMA